MSNRRYYVTVMLPIEFSLSSAIEFSLSFLFEQKWAYSENYCFWRHADELLVDWKVSRYFPLLQFLFHLERDGSYYLSLRLLMHEGSGHSVQGDNFYIFNKRKKNFLGLCLFSYTHMNYSSLLFFKCFPQEKMSWLSRSCMCKE